MSAQSPHTPSPDKHTPVYSALHFPVTGEHVKRKTSVFASFVGRPFYLDTQEGRLYYSPETTAEWTWTNPVTGETKSGYWAVLPSDGSLPYAMSQRYMFDNYEPIPPAP